MNYVVDASVVLKWFVTEAGTDAALRLRESATAGRDHLAAPDLLLYEVPNVLHWKRFTIEEIREATNTVLWSGIDLVVPDGELVGEATRIAAACDLSVYDACYAALAQQRQVTLLSYDRDFLRTGRLGISVLTPDAT